jgi:hypothetical protein
MEKFKFGMLTGLFEVVSNQIGFMMIVKDNKITSFMFAYFSSGVPSAVVFHKMNAQSGVFIRA